MYKKNLRNKHEILYIIINTIFLSFIHVHNYIHILDTLILKLCKKHIPVRSTCTVHGDIILYLALLLKR